MVVGGMRLTNLMKKVKETLRARQHGRKPSHEELTRAFISSVAALWAFGNIPKDNHDEKPPLNPYESFNDLLGAIEAIDPRPDAVTYTQCAYRNRTRIPGGYMANWQLTDLVTCNMALDVRSTGRVLLIIDQSIGSWSDYSISVRAHLLPQLLKTLGMWRDVEAAYVDAMADIERQNEKAAKMRELGSASIEAVLQAKAAESGLRFHMTLMARYAKVTFELSAEGRMVTQLSYKNFGSQIDDVVATAKELRDTLARHTATKVKLTAPQHGEQWHS